MTATRYKVIETALCIGDSVFDGEEVVVLAAEYERLEQECERLREQTGILVEFAQQMARQQGEPYLQKLAKEAIKKWSGL